MTFESLKLRFISTARGMFAVKRKLYIETNNGHRRCVLTDHRHKHGATTCVLSAEACSIGDGLFVHLNFPYVYTKEMLIAKLKSTRHWTHTDFPSVRCFGVWNGSVQEIRNGNMALNLYRIMSCYISYGTWWWCALIYLAKDRDRCPNFLFRKWLGISWQPERFLASE